MRVIYLALLLMGAPALAANIYTIDGGILPAFHSQLSDKFINESCFSVSTDVRRPILAEPEDNEFRIYYEYQQASLCKDGKGLIRGDRATILRTEGLPGALGRNGQPDDPVHVVTDNHHTTY